MSARFRMAVTIALFAFSAAPARAGSRAICAVPTWVVDGDQADGRYGTIAPAGDVNHDGYADVLVGCYNCSHPETNEGVVRLYLGGASGLATTPAWSAEANQAGAKMGDKLSGAGDVNGDGYDDLIVGAAFYTHTVTEEGAAFLYLGGPNGPSATPAWVTYGGQANAQYGACAQSAGDVNGDGYADIVVGQWLYSAAGAQFEGRAYLYLGGPAGPSTIPSWIGESGSPEAVYGYFCTGAGDVNGDGYGDLVVGARRFSGNGISKEGRVYVYYGSANGLSPVANWIHDGGQAGGEFGESVSTAGDVNGDGYGDLIVSAFRQDHPEVDEGVGYVFLGSASGLSQTPAWTAEGDQTNAYFAYHVDTAGDVNGDGFDDVVLSSSQYDVNGFTDAGRAYVYLGSASGLSTVPAWIQDGDETGGGLGNAVRGVGDVNGDGFGDVGTGALYHDIGGLVDAGRAYVFYGCPNGALAVDDPGATRLELRVAGPNPFWSGTSVTYSVPTTQRVTLSIVDVTGRVVARLLDATSAPGVHAVAWDGRARDGRRAAAGVYFARLVTRSGVRELKLVRM